MSFRFRSLFALAAVAAILFVSAGTQGFASVMVSNIGENPNTGNTVNLYQWRASRFTTGGVASNLQSITVAQYQDTPGTVYTGMLLYDNAGGPGSIYETLSSETPSTGFVDITYTSAGSLLAPSTSYWIATRTDGALGYMQGTNSTGYTSAHGWSITPLGASESSDSGATWWSSGAMVHRFTVDATLVPEPGSLLALGSGLLGAITLIRRRR